MKGLVLAGKNHIEWRDVEPPKIKTPFDAIARPLVVTPCSGDPHCIQTAQPVFLGKVFGHEGIGVIEEVGSQVKDFKAGDLVILPTVPAVWRSRMAQEGLAKLMLYSTDTDDVGYGGFFAEHTLVADADMNLAHIPENITMEQAIIIPDVLATGFSAAEATDIRFGDTVLVIGIGPIGLMAARGAVLKGAARVIGVGSRAVTFEAARKLGVTDLVNYKEGDIIEQVLDLTHGQLVDKVIIAGGADASQIFGAAMTLVRMGGIISSLAAFLENETVTLPNNQWFYGSRDKTIKAVQSQGGRVYLERLIAMVSAGRIDPSIVVTHKFHGLDKVTDALDLMASRDQTIMKAAVFTE